MNFIGIIADIAASRIVSARSQLQEKLYHTLEEINNRRGLALASPFTITLGDEFQALYRAPAGLFADLWKISASLHPVKIRYSVAAGSLSTAVNEEQALGMDGPVFYTARDCLAVAKEQKLMFHLGGKIPSLDLINDALGLVAHHARNWSGNRLAIVADLSEGKPVKEIAQAIGISESAVYKNINAAALDTVVALTRGIESSLNQALENSERC